MDQVAFGIGRRCRRARLEGVGVKQPDGQGEGAMGRLGRYRGRPFRHQVRVPKLDETGGSVSRRQLAGIFAARAKGEMRLPGPIERTQIVDLSGTVIVMHELRADRVRNHLKAKGTPALEKSGVLQSFLLG
jgi:hypothetical protein